MTARETTVVRPRPTAVTIAVGVLAFLGVTAVLGGVELAFGLWISEPPPADWLDAIPLIDGWVLPGLVLAVGFGLGSLVAAYGMLRRPRTAWLAPVQRLTGHHWSWTMTIGLGLGMIAWIGLEIVYLPARSWLEALYGAVGLALVLMPALPPVGRHLSA
ncbi:hypothetical protein [Mangrovihabitans endophyticus]|uniref:Uncharacterized protein n=1 Tax=Mangrovihabitans endophyticus TaxID=1751298 RepID=A0A8J3FMS0_9ACTN|nr:hypothetical protein [Mangrovihabitans endophyticus]GGK78312.1 hypothetical protein GCM10012284_10280 [Mangrovihabitans endophyticus]